MLAAAPTADIGGERAGGVRCKSGVAVTEFREWLLPVDGAGGHVDDALRRARALQQRRGHAIVRRIGWERVDEVKCGRPCVWPGHDRAEGMHEDVRVVPVLGALRWNRFISDHKERYLGQML